MLVGLFAPTFALTGCVLVADNFASADPDPFFFAPDPFFLDITAPFDRPTLRRSTDQE